MELRGIVCEYVSTDSYKQVGLLNDIKSKVALIHIHGMGSFFWKGSFVYDACIRAGIGCFLINTRGAGPVLKLKSDIDEKDKLWAGTSNEIFVDCMKDIEGAINFLKSKGYEKFIICGHSTGSQKSLYFGLNYKRQDEILGYVFLAAGDDFNLIRDRYVENFDEVFKKTLKTYDSPMIFAIPEIGYFTSKRFYDLVKEDSVEGNLFNYKTDLMHIQKIKQPIFAAFGSDEEHALIEVDEMLQKISQNFLNKKSIWKIVPGDHSFRGGEKELVDELGVWLKEIV